MMGLMPGYFSFHRKMCQTNLISIEQFLMFFSAESSSMNYSAKVLHNRLNVWLPFYFGADSDGSRGLAFRKRCKIAL